MLSVVILMLRVVMLSVVMLGVVMLSVVMLSIVAPHSLPLHIKQDEIVLPMSCTLEWCYAFILLRNSRQGWGSCTSSAAELGGVYAGVKTIILVAAAGDGNLWR